MIYHFYKADCYRASRVLMQSRWEGESTFIHISKNDKYTKNIKFGWRAIQLLTPRLNENDVVIFHAQSSLPYLAVSFFIKKILNKKFLQIYDIHDLHEENSNLKFFSRNSLRYLALGLLEKLIFSISEIKKITVSSGLAKTMAEKYKCMMPEIIRNISKNTQGKPRDPNQRNKNSIIFFGTKERAPLETSKILESNKIELHLFGKDIEEQWVKETLDLQELKNIKIFGEYDPENMSFLEDYRILIIYSPNDQSKNFKFSLPNKLFQALGHGLSVIVSENFEEMVELFSSTNMSVIAVNENNLVATINKIISERSTNDIENIQKMIEEMYSNERIKYLKIINS